MIYSVTTSPLPGYVTFNSGVPSIDLNSITIADVGDDTITFVASESVSGLSDTQTLTI